MSKSVSFATNIGSYNFQVEIKEYEGGTLSVVPIGPLSDGADFVEIPISTTSGDLPRLARHIKEVCDYLGLKE